MPNVGATPSPDRIQRSGARRCHHLPDDRCVAAGGVGGRPAGWRSTPAVPVALLRVVRRRHGLDQCRPARRGRRWSTRRHRARGRPPVGRAGPGGSNVGGSAGEQPAGLDPVRAAPRRAAAAHEPRRQSLRCAACERVAKVSPDLKWPNDLLLDGAKLAGVLAEAGSQRGRLTSVVVGLGLNVGSGAVRRGPSAAGNPGRGAVAPARRARPPPRRHPRRVPAAARHLGHGRAGRSARRRVRRPGGRRRARWTARHRDPGREATGLGW